jgi:hypothetical protein
MSYPDRSFDLNQDGVGMTNGALPGVRREAGAKPMGGYGGLSPVLAIGECARDDIVNVA